MKKECIVTITDGISPTSMPFNEFVTYRLNNYPDEKQILIQLFESGIDKRISIPESVEFYSIGKNIIALRELIKGIEKHYRVKAYHIHEGKSVILFSLATLFAKKNKVVYTLHSTYRNYPFHNKLFAFTASLLSKKIVCVSKTSLKYYPSLLKFVIGKRILAIQNGVDLSRINKITQPQIPENKQFTLVYVARLVELKRHNMLLDIVSNIPDIRLFLIGQGPLENELKKRCQSLGIENRVFFTGLLSREDVYNYLKNSDVYISTSSYEGLPIGVLEAMGCGKICIVSAIEQHLEIAVDCPSLITVDDDLNHWVTEINRLKCLSYNERLQIGTLNKDSVVKSFTLKKMHEAYDGVYSSLNQSVN